MIISERREDAILARVVRKRDGGSGLGEEAGDGERDISELRPKL